MGRALSVLVVQINHQDGHKAQILRGGPLTGRCSESEVENHLQVLPPTSGLPPGGRDPFCPQILIRPHLPGYYSPGGAGVSLWDAGETTGVCHGDDTFANASLGRGRAHLVKLEQGFPPPPRCITAADGCVGRSAPRKDSSSLKKSGLWGLGVSDLHVCVCLSLAMSIPCSSCERIFSRLGPTTVVLL